MNNGFQQMWTEIKNLWNNALVWELMRPPPSKIMGELLSGATNVRD